MNPSRYFMPMMGRNPMLYSNNFYPNFNIANLINKFTTSIKKFNWKGTLTGINKTLNVVNQTIPLVKEAKPMYDNMKSIFQITKAFKKETTTQKNYYHNNYQKKNIANKPIDSDTNKPIFFI